jgi:hypothetical protein
VADRNDKDIIDEFRERLDRARQHQHEAHEHFREDVRFANGDDLNNYQWDDKTRTSRVDRPCLTINKARIHCLQVINDARQNPAQIRISPTGERATYEAAQIYQGVCRHIEYISNAQLAYATATYNQVVGGIGYWRVLTDYVDEESFDQDIFIRRIPDPTKVYLDPDIQQYDGSDAAWGVIVSEMERNAYKEKYPRRGDDDDRPDYDDDTDTNVPIADLPEHRTDEKHVALMEYYRRGDRDDELLELVDGRVIRSSELPDGVLPVLKARRLVGRTRKIAVPEIEWFLIVDNEIIDRKAWPGRYVPIVRVPCEEIIVDGKLDWVSHTRHLRDAQRLYNWYSSSAAEFVALQSKAPFIGTAEALGPYQQAWEQANTTNPSVLLYQGFDPETGTALPMPQRAQPPVMAQAYIEGLKVAQAEMMMATGQYQAVMGQPSNETSGVAINARQRQGDNATYHVIDHLASAIRFTGRILIDLIPKVYNTERVLLIMDDTGSEQTIHVDPNAQHAHQVQPDPNRPPATTMNGDGQADPAQAIRTIWNPNVGRYAVESDVGPSYATKRQQAFDAFSQIMARNPAAWQVIGDFWAQNADFPGADQLADRMKKGLPPQYKDDGPDPQVVQLQQQLQTVAAHGQKLAQQADAEVSSLKAQVVHLQEQLADKIYDAETKRLDTVGKIDPDSVKLVVRELVSRMLGMPALPVMAAHAEAEQAMAPPEPAGAEGATVQ